jgi:hypothetical protein
VPPVHSDLFDVPVLIAQVLHQGVPAHGRPMSGLRIQQAQ